MNTAQADLGSTIPHNVEVEQYLLSACLIDEAKGEVVAKAVDAGVTPETFYDPANAILFRTLVSMRDKGLIIDIPTLGEELKAGKHLEAIGGWSALTRVSGLVPTTESAGNNIGLLLDLAQRRTVYEVGQHLVSACQRSDKTTAELVEEVGVLYNSTSLTAGPMGRRLASVLLSADKEPAPLRSVYRIGKATIATPGNLVTVKGHSKAGKSAFIGGMIGAVLQGPDGQGDCLGVVSENPRGLAVVAFDTEQSQRDHWDNFRTSLKRAGLTAAPAWFRSYALTGWSIPDRLQALHHALEIGKRECGGIHSLLLDGCADFVSDPNEAAECFGFVDHLQALGVRYDCSIICVLHLNPNSIDKGRGHLGSHLERRSETNLSLEYDSETGRTVVYAERCRHKPIPKPDGPTFRWGEESQMHVSTETMRREKDQEDLADLSELARDCYADRQPKRVRYSDLVELIKLTAKCSERSAKTKLAAMKRLSVIKEVPPRLLELNV